MPVKLKPRALHHFTMAAKVILVVINVVAYGVSPFVDDQMPILTETTAATLVTTVSGLLGIYAVWRRSPPLLILTFLIGIIVCVIQFPLLVMMIRMLSDCHGLSDDTIEQALYCQGVNDINSLDHAAQVAAQCGNLGLAQTKGTVWCPQLKEHFQLIVGGFTALLVINLTLSIFLIAVGYSWMPELHLLMNEHEDLVNRSLAKAAGVKDEDFEVDYRVFIGRTAKMAERLAVPTDDEDEDEDEG
jgi:hypothetical protein